MGIAFLSDVKYLALLIIGDGIVEVFTALRVTLFQAQNDCLFYILLSPYLCFISFLYLDMYLL